jgi:hypothetical protein
MPESRDAYPPFVNKGAGRLVDSRWSLFPGLQLAGPEIGRLRPRYRKGAESFQLFPIPGPRMWASGGLGFKPDPRALTTRRFGGGREVTKLRFLIPFIRRFSSWFDPWASVRSPILPKPESF